MLALASILITFATIICLYFRAPDRGRDGKFPHTIGPRKALGMATIIGLAGGLALAVVDQGWAAGIGLWLAALMVSGVAVVSLAGSYPTLTQRLGYSSAAVGLLLATTRWALF